jgi:hypothetical protein
VLTSNDIQAGPMLEYATRAQHPVSCLRHGGSTNGESRDPVAGSKNHGYRGVYELAKA